jgi:hypothetical protein
MAKKEKVNVLGTEYTIKYKTQEEDLALLECDGYCDFTTKDIMVKLYETDSPLAFNDINSYYRHVVRHEIAHAFMYESGLNVCNDYARNEELIDWIAIQLPKLAKAVERYM